MTSDPTFKWALVPHPRLPGIGPKMQRWVALCAQYIKVPGVTPHRILPLSRFLHGYVALHGYYEPEAILMPAQNLELPPLCGPKGKAPYRTTKNGEYDQNHLFSFLRWVVLNDPIFKSVQGKEMPFQLLYGKASPLPLLSFWRRRLTGVNFAKDNSFEWALTEQPGFPGTGPQMARWVELCSRYMQTPPASPRDARKTLARFLYAYVAMHGLYDPKTLLTEDPGFKCPPIQGNPDEAPFRYDKDLPSKHRRLSSGSRAVNRLITFLEWVTRNDPALRGEEGVKVPFARASSRTFYNGTRAAAAKLDIGAVEVSVDGESEHEVMRIAGVTLGHDDTFQWASIKHREVPGCGPAMEIWVDLCRRYMKTIHKNYAGNISALAGFLHSYVALHRYYRPENLLMAAERTVFPPLIGPFGKAPCREDTAYGITQVSKLVDFLAWVCKHYEGFFDEDDNGNKVWLSNIRVPFEKIDGGSSRIPRRSKSDKDPLPIQCIDEIREIIAPGKNFSNWEWARNLYPSKSGRQAGDWFLTDDPKLIVQEKLKPGDPGYDPDFVARYVKSPIYRVTQGGHHAAIDERLELQVWCPSRTMAVLLKTLLPLRTFQVRALDSGEADIERVELVETIGKDGKVVCDFIWSDNSEHRTRMLARLDPEDRKKVGLQQGVFRRFKPRFSTSGELTGFFINTNKTADSGKEAGDRGYAVPWQYDTALRWLIKLRNWQEKYNPIERPALWRELTSKHIPKKSEVEIRKMPPTCFLFRDASCRNRVPTRGKYTFAKGVSAVANRKASYSKETRELALREATLILTNSQVDQFWGYVLLQYESDMNVKGYKMGNGRPFRFIEKIHKENAQRVGISGITTYFSLHSLRVSLISALCFDGKVELPTLLVLAGHARIVMTIYYAKQTETSIHDELKKGTAKASALAPDSFIKWASDRSFSEIKDESYFCDEGQARVTLGDSPKERNFTSVIPVPDGFCLAGGNTSPSTPGQPRLNGCWNGGELLTKSNGKNLGIYRSVPMRCCAESHCRHLWVTVDKLESVKTKFNTRAKKLFELNDRYAQLDFEFQRLAAAKYDAEKNRKRHVDGEPYDRSRYDQVSVLMQRVESDREQLKCMLSTLCDIIANLVVIMAASREAKDGKTHALSLGPIPQAMVRLVNLDEEETLHLSYLCRDLVLYPEEQPANADAFLRLSQRLDKMFHREMGKPLLLQFDLETQMEIGQQAVEVMMRAKRAEQEALGFQLEDFEVLTLTSKVIDGESPLTGPTRAALEGVVSSAVSVVKKLPSSSTKLLQ